MTHRIRPPRTSRRAARGFSMLELTFVLVIIGLLLGVATYSFVAAGNSGRITATKATMSTIGGSVQQYQLTHGSFPTSLSSLIPTYMPVGTNLNDGWGRPIVFVPQTSDPNRPFTIISAGADGQTGTPDDIDYWTMKQQTPGGG